MARSAAFQRLARIIRIARFCDRHDLATREGAERAAALVRALIGFLPIQGETVVLKPGSESAAGGDLVGLIAAPE